MYFLIFSQKYFSSCISIYYLYAFHVCVYIFLYILYTFLYICCFICFLFVLFICFFVNISVGCYFIVWYIYNIHIFTFFTYKYYSLLHFAHLCFSTCTFVYFHICIILYFHILVIVYFHIFLHCIFSYFHIFFVVHISNNFYFIFLQLLLVVMYYCICDWMPFCDCVLKSDCHLSKTFASLKAL